MCRTLLTDASNSYHIAGILFPVYKLSPKYIFREIVYSSMHAYNIKFVGKKCSRYILNQRKLQTFLEIIHGII